jgi:type IV secretory pathway TraG/TraD family ATPase VirD4
MGHVFLCLQSLNQMKELFGDAAQTIRSGIDNLIFFGIRDKETATELSDLIGDTTVRSVSHSTSTTTTSPTFSLMSMGDGKGSSGGQSSNTAGTTLTEGARKLIQPAEILRAWKRTMFVIVPELPPVQVVQVRYFEDQRMSDLVAGRFQRDERSESAHEAMASPPEGFAETKGDSPLEERIRFECRCGKAYSVSSSMKRKLAKCGNPSCPRTFRIPDRSPKPRTQGA